MLLNGREIKEAGLLIGAEDNNYTKASYYLTVGGIITMDGKIHDEYIIPPRGMVVIVSKEIFNLPENIIGYTTVKNSLSVNGLMAINVGLVDPLWHKPISSSMINFGSQKQILKKGDQFLRMTFQRFEDFNIDDIQKTSPIITKEKKQIENGISDHLHAMKSEICSIAKIIRNKVFISSSKGYNKVSTEQLIYNEYFNERKKESIKALSETFLSINQIKKEITDNVIGSFLRRLAYIAAGIAIIGFIISYSADFVKYRNLVRHNKENCRIDSLNKKIDSLTVVINSVIQNEERNSLEQNVNRGMESKRK